MSCQSKGVYKLTSYALRTFTIAWLNPSHSKDHSADSFNYIHPTRQFLCRYQPTRASNSFFMAHYIDGFSYTCLNYAIEPMLLNTHLGTSSGVTGEMSWFLLSSYRIAYLWDSKVLSGRSVLFHCVFFEKGPGIVLFVNAISSRSCI